MKRDFELPEFLKKGGNVPELSPPPNFFWLVQDRMSELITHCDNQKRVQEIAKELYWEATKRIAT